MSETSNGDGAAGSVGDLDLPQNKKDSEKNRREQENLCIEELAMLISAQIPELSDSDDSSSTTDASRLEKGSILQDTVDKLKSLRAQLKVSFFYEIRKISSHNQELLRYESSTLILYKELSSPIFQSCQSVSQ